MLERSRAAALAVLCALLGAAPATGDGFYVEIEPGASTLADADLTVTTDFFDGGEASGDIESEPTWAIGGSVGYRYGGFRVEVDASRRALDFDEVTLLDPDLPGGGGEIGDDGDLTLYLGLVNAFYGMRFGRFEPFVGAGLGFADLDIDGDYGANVLDVDEGSTEFAWSVSGGVSAFVHEHVAVSIGYRYVGMTDPDFATVPYIQDNPPPSPDSSFNGRAEIEVVLHELFAGIRYEF